jgi:hypothetical protein
MMRGIALFVAAAALAACSTSIGGGESLGPSPFPVERGSAIPPPDGNGARAHAVPPEGAAAGGLDFGQWRSADPASYAPSFQQQVRTRFAGQNAAALKASLEANGFACEESGRLDCRIEIMERQCAYDWYVVLERGRAEPVAGFDQMCLGAR